MSDNKYKNGKIYTIRCKTDNNLIYVGSTIENRLSARFGKHKYQKGCYLYKFINTPENKTLWDDWYIELYEEYPCENKMQLVKRENEIIRNVATINKIGYRTEESIKEYYKEYTEKNKDKIKERNKIYVENNRDKILQKKSEYNEANRENKSNYMKQRYEDRKEEFLTKTKEYVEKNKEYILEKIVCSCGCIISRKGMREHERTKKHLSFVENIKK